MPRRPITANTLFYGDNLDILREYPRMQLLTIAELLRGATVKMPDEFGTFKQARRVRQQDGEQLGFDGVE